MINGKDILYLCNGKRCRICSEECNHTTNPDYAINPTFEESRFKKNEMGDWWEVANESQGLHSNSK